MSADKTDAPATPTGVETHRIQSLDGVRGIAIILVVLSHSWLLVPFGERAENPITRWLFVNGNIAVTIFFVIGGYLAGRGLMTSTYLESPVGGMRWLLRRVVRIGATVYALLAVLMIVSVLDSTETYTADQTRNSVVRIMTFTWNWWVQSNALYARSDIGHLWYVSVFVQVLIMLTIAFTFLRRRPWVLSAVLLAAIVASNFRRVHVLHGENEFIGLLQTWSRMDAMLWGALIAVLMTVLAPKILQGVRERSRVIVAVGAVGVATSLVVTRGATDYLDWSGTLYTLAVVVLVVGLLTVPTSNRLSRVLSWRPLAFAGHESLSIFVWHYPVFYAVSRHSAEWLSVTRAVVAVVITVAVIEASRRWVDRPARQWLRTHLVAPTDRAGGSPAQER